MRLLDRYLLRELCIPLFYCLAGFLIFWVSFDLFSDLDEFQRSGLSAAEITAYYLIRIPELLVSEVMPVSLLLGMLYALSQHGRHNEIIAMRAAGLSLWRISVPYLGVGFFLSCFLFVLNEKVVAQNTERAREIREGNDQSRRSEWITRVNFRNARENRIWNIGAFHSKTHELINPHVEWLMADGSRKQIIAQAAVRTNDQWLFKNVELFHYPPQVDFEKDSFSIRTNTLVMPELTETPEQIKLQIKFNRLNAVEASKRPQLDLEEIQYLRSHLELNPRQSALLQTQFHARLAQPWTCLVVALIALPFGVGTHSRRNVFVGVASSIFICFAYFILLRLGLALGNGLYLPPALGAWLPNIFFATLGLWLTWKVK